MVPLLVVMYKASEKEYRHWALCLEGPKRNQYTIYQVNGDTHEYEYDKTELKKAPDKSKRYYASVHVTDGLDDPEAAEAVLEKVPIDNDSPGWNCQEWVLAALELLKDEDLIPEHDYENAEAELQSFAGPNDDSDAG
jgi:hypothetical protein